MVVVIIAMAFIGILASVLMYMSLLNYQMKVNNLKAKDNFYSAETVLDDHKYLRRLNKPAAGPFWRPSTIRLSISDAIACGNRFCLYATVSQRSKNAC